jgi:hypothetical protein
MKRFPWLHNPNRSTEDLRQNLLSLNKSDLAAALAKTDWHIIRAADPTSGKSLADAVLQEREQLRQQCDKVEIEILAAVSHEELLAIYQQYL